MSGSALYVGRVFHHRFTPRDHRLCYPVFQLLIDLDQAALGRGTGVFSFNRFNLMSHHGRDHGDGRSGDLRAWARKALAASGVDARIGRIQLLAMPRILGFVFNPLSIYFCHDTDDRLAAVIYEVDNTFGERRHYVLPAETDTSGHVRQACGKSFRVSPFMPMDLDYVFDLNLPGATIRTAIEVRDPAGHLVMNASFHGRRRPLADRALLAAFFSVPLLTLGVVVAIHFEALKLWLKGVPLQADSLRRWPARGRLSSQGRIRPSPPRSSTSASKARSPG